MNEENLVEEDDFDETEVDPNADTVIMPALVDGQSDDALESEE